MKRKSQRGEDRRDRETDGQTHRQTDKQALSEVVVRERAAGDHSERERERERESGRVTYG